MVPACDCPQAAMHACQLQLTRLFIDGCGRNAPWTSSWKTTRAVDIGHTHGRVGGSAKHLLKVHGLAADRAGVAALQPLIDAAQVVSVLALCQDLRVLCMQHIMSSAMVMGSTV